MRIEIDDYIISNIPYNIVIEKKIKVKPKSKSKSKSHLRKDEKDGLSLVSYCSSRNLDDFICFLLEEKLTNSSATSIEELRSDLEKARLDILEGIKNCKLIEDLKEEYNKESGVIDKPENNRDNSIKAPVKKLEKPKSTSKSTSKSRSKTKAKSQTKNK